MDFKPNQTRHYKNKLAAETEAGKLVAITRKASITDNILYSNLKSQRL